MKGKVVALVPVKEGKLWAEMFENPEQLTVEDILGVTFDQNRDLGHLLSYLDFKPEFSGILREVVEEFLETMVRDLLPEAILSSASFARLMSGDIRRLYDHDGGEIVRDSLYRFFKRLDDAGTDIGKQPACMDDCPFLEFAIVAHIEFGLEAYSEAFGAGCLALNENDVASFPPDSGENDQKQLASLICIMMSATEILLKKAVDMKKKASEAFPV